VARDIDDQPPRTPRGQSDRPADLTPEELAALLDMALGASSWKIPAIILAKLVALRRVAMTENGPVVTGDGG
jgi:hypothetical protein